MRFHFIVSAHKKDFREIDISLKSFFLGGTYEKVRKNYKNVWGGVLVLSAILALSLIFASCANSSDSDDENSSPTLPANVGENPITKTIKLKTSEDSSHYLELKTDGTALYISEKEVVARTYCKYKYTYDTDLKRIYMRVEKTVFGDELLYIAGASEEELLTYDEICSKINEYYTVEKIRAGLKKWYNENKERIEERHSDCKSYEDYESEFIKQDEFKTFDDYVKYYKRMYENYCKAQFGAQITYAYNTKDGKITLTEKFTGVKNLLDSECKFRAETGYDSIYIDCYSASRSIEDDDFYYWYYGTLDTDKRTIDFKKQKETRSDDGDYEYEVIGHVNATYTEDIGRGTVTINCEGKEYVCKFEGEKYTQVE